MSGRQAAEAGNNRKNEKRSDYHRNRKGEWAFVLAAQRSRRNAKLFLGVMICVNIVLLYLALTR